MTEHLVGAAAMWEIQNEEQEPEQQDDEGQKLPPNGIKSESSLSINLLCLKQNT